MECKKLKTAWVKTWEHNREICINPAEICYIQAARCYSCIFLETGKYHLACEPLKYFESHLPCKHFYRCHRSYLVNMLEVEFADIKERILYQKLYQIPFSRRKTAELLSEWTIRIVNR